MQLFKLQLSPDGKTVHLYDEDNISCGIFLASKPEIKDLISGKREVYILGEVVEGGYLENIRLAPRKN